MLSIAICTHNRSTDVGVCLGKLYPQMDFKTMELILVDSASSPAEAAILDHCLQKYPDVHLIRLAEAGISLARNTALAVARGSWLAFLDDDAIPEHDWVAQVLRLIAIAPDDCAIVGGDIGPVFPEGCRPRLGRRWRQLLSLVDQPDESFSASDVSVCGVNSVYRRSFLVGCQGFPESLGRVGTKLLSGEEKLVQEIALLSGWCVARSDRLRVGHRIEAGRLKRSWVIDRAYWDGLSDERIRGMLGQRTTLLGALDLAARLLVLGALYPLSPERQEFFLRFWYTLGRLREWSSRAVLPLPGQALAHTPGRRSEASAPGETRVHHRAAASRP